MAMVKTQARIELVPTSILRVEHVLILTGKLILFSSLGVRDWFGEEVLLLTPR